MTDRPRFGIVLQGVDRPAEFRELVRSIEDAGFDNLWLTDSSLHARDVYSYLTLAATVTSRIKLGVSVTNPLTRHPALGALAIATVDEVSGGRAIYGMGVGDRPTQALGYQPARLASLRLAVETSRRLWAGETVSLQSEDFSMDHAHLRVQARPDIPIYLSASGPRTLALAGEIADGVIFLGGLFRQGLDYALSHVREGQQRTERPAPDVAVFAYGALGENAPEAIEAARPIAAWFCQTAPVYCELAGMPPEMVQKVRSAYDGGEFQEANRAAQLIPDDLVRKLSFCGTPDEGLAKVESLVEYGVRSVNFFPLGNARHESIRHFARHILPRFR